MHIHWHKFCFEKGIWAYHECRCGHRVARRLTKLVGPQDVDWLEHRAPREMTVPPAVTPDP